MMPKIISHMEHFIGRHVGGTLRHAPVRARYTPTSRTVKWSITAPASTSGRTRTPTAGSFFFWTTVRCEYCSTYHRMSSKHLPWFVNEFVGQLIERFRNAVDMMAAPAGHKVGKMFMYAQLVATHGLGRVQVQPKRQYDARAGYRIAATPPPREHHAGPDGQRLQLILDAIMNHVVCA